MINRGYILFAEEMRSGEQAVIDVGVSVDELMLRAGRGAAHYIWRMSSEAPCLILCGPGNNGGDGYVIAQWLLEKGVDVTVAISAEPNTDAALNAKANWKGTTIGLEEAKPKDIFVDCLFGTGLSRPVSSELQRDIKRLAIAAKKNIAIDLPSGIETNAGEMLNEVPPYDLTIALGAYKPAHFLSPARGYLGQVVGVDLEIEVESNLSILETPQIKEPKISDHKYTRGLVCVLAGAMPGAANLTAMAAQKSGAGYVKIISADKAESPNNSIVCQTYSDGEQLASLLADHRIDIIVVGPGLGRDRQAQEILKAALAAKKPLLLDADALVLLGSEIDSQLSGLEQDVVLTPHEGEFKNICGDEVGSKIERTIALSKRSNATILYKGADTVISSSVGEVAISSHSSPWLSTAGTGDVLSGVIAARYVGERDGYVAAKQGQWLHMRAAQLSGPAFTPEVLIDNLPSAIDECLI